MPGRGELKSTSPSAWQSAGWPAAEGGVVSRVAVSCVGGDVSSAGHLWAMRGSWA